MNRLLIISLLFLTASAPGDARKANEAYEQGDYEKAAGLYREALQSDPDNPRLHFNLGNSLARMGQPEEAQQAFERFRSLTDDPVEQALADYNIGNLLAEEQELESAAEYFKQALRNNPEDPDAKHNYELALKQQQEQEQQEQNQSEEEQEQEQNPDQDQQQEQNQQTPPDQQQNSGDGSRQQDADMSMEEAQSILEALEQRERDLLKERRKDVEEERNSNDKDW